MGSLAQSEQKDQRVVADQAELVVAPEAQFTSPSSIAIMADRSSNVKLSDVIFNEFPEALQQSIGDILETVTETNIITAETSRITQTETLPSLVESFNEAVGQAAKTNLEVTEQLGQKLQETQLGQASILPGMAKYLTIAVVIIIIARLYFK